MAEAARFCPSCGTAVGAPSPTPSQRRINTAGGDIVEGVKVEGNLIIHHQPGSMRRDRVDEYQAEFRGLLDRIQGVRDWLTQDERATLNQRASLLELQDFERRDAENTILAGAKMQLRQRPSEFWWVASTSAHLAKDLELPAAIQAIAGLLDSHDPEKLFTSVDHGVTWQRLTTATQLFDQVRQARINRFQKGLIEWVRRGQPAAGIANLH